MHPHIPRPRRKATRTCTDTAGVVRTVHGEFMWPFTARVNEKPHRSNGSLPLQFAAAYRRAVRHSKIGRSMSALGQKQTCAVQTVMSALPPIATAKADSRKRIMSL